MMGSDARRIKPSAKLSVRDMPEPRSMTSAWKCSWCGSLSLIKGGGSADFLHMNVQVVIPCCSWPGTQAAKGTALGNSHKEH